MPSLNNICDDFVELLKMKRNNNDVVDNFQDVANLMGLEGIFFDVFILFEY